MSLGQPGCWTSQSHDSDTSHHTRWQSQTASSSITTFRRLAGCTTNHVGRSAIVWWGSQSSSRPQTCLQSVWTACVQMWQVGRCTGSPWPDLSEKRIKTTVISAITVDVWSLLNSSCFFPAKALILCCPPFSRCFEDCFKSTACCRGCRYPRKSAWNSGDLCSAASCWAGYALCTATAYRNYQWLKFAA